MPTCQVVWWPDWYVRHEWLVCPRRLDNIMSTIHLVVSNSTALFLYFHSLQARYLFIPELLLCHRNKQLSSIKTWVKCTMGHCQGVFTADLHTEQKKILISKVQYSNSFRQLGFSEYKTLKLFKNLLIHFGVWKYHTWVICVCALPSYPMSSCGIVH